MTSRTSQDLPTISSSTLELFHKLSETAQGLRPFLQPTKHNHSSSKEGAAIVAEWQSNGENIITKHFAYTTMIGDAHPAGEPRTMDSEVNRVAHTLSHLRYALYETREWILTYLRSGPETKDLNGVLDLVSELDKITKQAVHQLEESNSEVGTLARIIYKTVKQACLDKLAGYWRVKDIMRADSSSTLPQRIKKDGEELFRQCGKPPKLGQYLSEVYTLVSPEACGTSLTPEEEVQRRNNLEFCIGDVREEFREPLEAFRDSLEGVGNLSKPLSRDEVLKELEALKGYLHNVTSPITRGDSIETLHGPSTNQQEVSSAAADLSRRLDALTEMVHECLSLTARYVRARDKIRSCSRSNYHLPLDFQASTDEDSEEVYTDESDTGSVE